MVWNETLKREIPEGWEVSKIKDLAKVYSGGTPTSSNQSYYENGKIPWINSGELNNPFITKAENFITESGLNNSSAKYYPTGSILVALYGATAGKVSYLGFEACSNQAVCGVVPNDSNLSIYIMYFLSSLYSYYVTLSSGSARDNISGDTIKNTWMIIPPFNLLEKYETIAVNSISLIINKQKETEDLSAQRNLLLPLLMNGQVTIKQ